MDDRFMCGGLRCSSGVAGENGMVIVGQNHNGYDPAAPGAVWR